MARYFRQGNVGIQIINLCIPNDNTFFAPVYCMVHKSQAGYYRVYNVVYRLKYCKQII